MKFDRESRAALSGDAGADPGLLGFAERFLHLTGAVVETGGSGLDALVPDEMQALLDTPEHIRIRGGDAPEDTDGGGYVMGYGAPLLDRMIETALRKIPLLFCTLKFDYIKSGGFNRLLCDQLTFYGAVARIESIAEVVTDYILVACRYKAQSDEQKEGLIKMAFNCDTGRLVPDMGRALDGAVCRISFENFASPAMAGFLRHGGNMMKHAEGRLHHQLKSFHESMNRRFVRDVNNLREYYRSLETEMAKTLENPALSDTARRDRRTKIDALPEELSRKTDDLFKKYSIRVSMHPAAAMVIRTPGKKIICKLSVGKKSRQLFLTYNPVIRALEPPACTRCQKNISHIHFSGDFEPLCFECRGR